MSAYGSRQKNWIFYGPADAPSPPAYGANTTLDDVAISLILSPSFPKVAFDVAQFWVSRADYNKSREAWEIRHALFWIMKVNFFIEMYL